MSDLLNRTRYRAEIVNYTPAPLIQTCGGIVVEENAEKCQDFARHAQGGISKVNVHICISALKRVRVERTDINDGLGNAQQE